MLLHQDPRRQGGGIISYKNGHDCLRKDSAVVQFRRHAVHSSACKLATCINRTLVCVEPGECRQEGRVYVDEAPGVMRYKTRCEDAHETSQHHQCRTVRVYGLLKRGVERIARVKTFVVQHCRLKPERCGRSKPLGIGPVADHAGYAGIELFFPLLRLSRLRNGYHVGTVARDQNNDVFFMPAHAL